jgi:hypothetical protein
VALFGQMLGRSVRRGSFSYQLPYVAPLYRSIYGIEPTGTLHCPIVPYCNDCQSVLREIRRHHHKTWRHLNFTRSNRHSPSSIISITPFGDVHHDVLEFVISFTIGISGTPATAAKLFSIILSECMSSSIFPDEWKMLISSYSTS